MSVESSLWRLNSRILAWLSRGRSRLYAEAGAGGPCQLREWTQQGARRRFNLLMRAPIELIGRWVAIPE